MNERTVKPDFLFETSWEICNKVGGINTVVATKSLILVNEFNDKFVLIGPDLWRETKQNPAFIEDESLFSSWKYKANEEGLRVRIGRWDIVSKPIVILIDFTPFISKKNEIFKSFWETYKLDSISGGMDYIEAATFGYAAGKVIESFCKYHLTTRDKVVAHFHEWMTGSGILYLRKTVPQIATVFTTHATAVGRSIAGNGLPLYSKLEEYNGDSKAKELNIVAKQSMEKISAKTTDAFTTVSEITATECKQFLEKEVDVVTPNGFEDNFVPVGEEFTKKREAARLKMKEIAEALLGYKLSDDALFIANSGRYEFRNKGIDVFISAMGELNKQEDLNKEVVSFVLVPANNYGPRKDLQEKLAGKNDKKLDQTFLTHGLHDSEYDPILNEIKSTGLSNKKDDNVKIIFAPCYLNGTDGIFNLKYYDVLIGLDLTVFPSYYEPWGYTPLESLAFHIPTITTNLAGIGMWVNRELVSVNDGIEVFERKVGKDPNVIRDIVNKIVSFSHKSDFDKKQARENAFSISRIALWKNLIRYYKDAYTIAIDKVQNRSDSFVDITTEQIVIPQIPKSNQPVWKTMTVKPNLPERFKALDKLSKNLWWSWNYEAIELFESIDPKLWQKCRQNPILLLKEVSYERFTELEEDEDFTIRYNTVLTRFTKYMEQKDTKKTPQIAYFSMEFGLSDTIKIYSGGLGLLAGDYLKEASDSNVNMVGVGFLYKYGYFTQQLSLKGEQLATYEAQNFSNLPVIPEKDENGNWRTIQVAFPGRIVVAKIWRVNVGRVPLFLLDTEIPENREEDRSISHQLYGGDNEHRLKQEMLLGIGGMRALESLNIDADLYHCNEGHAALIGLERLRRLITDENLTFGESLEIVRASTLFTTHTPVPAGHDVFPEDLIMIYMGHYPERLKITWEEFINLGKLNPGDKHEKFSMSHLAISISQEINGVSKLHGEVSREMFKRLWEGYFTEELHIGYVTNGVHYPSWAAKEWRELHDKEFGKDFIKNSSNKEFWKNIYKVDDKEIWNIRQSQRRMLIKYLKQRLNSNWIKRHVDPKQIIAVQNKINDKALIIGFARRFATYKRAHLLFENLERLEKIINNPERPVQILFAGKAHPNDGAGQDLIKKIVEISNRPEFIGKIIFLQNYDIDLAKKLVQGVDIWLNTPTRPLEASGTSGMKAVMNGVLNFSVLDGWWVEGYKEEAGWALPEEKTFTRQDFQDDLDAETLYTTLEKDIVPKFYDRDENGVPGEWVKYIKNCIANIAPDFTTKRMMDDYFDRFYNKLYERTKKIKQNDYEMAKQIATWKKRIYHGWNSVEIVSVDFPDSSKVQLASGEKYHGEVVLNLNELADYEVGVEVVITDVLPENKRKIIEIKELEKVKKEGSVVYYQIELVPPRPGVFNYGLRVFPKNEDLPHRQDFSYLRWI